MRRRAVLKMVEEVLQELQGQKPHTAKCLAVEGRTVTWFPTFSEEPIWVIDPNSPSRHMGRMSDPPSKVCDPLSSLAHKVNFYYQCSYSGSPTCAYCISHKGYKRPISGFY